MENDSNIRDNNFSLFLCGARGVREKQGVVLSAGMTGRWGPPSVRVSVCLPTCALHMCMYTCTVSSPMKTRNLYVMADSLAWLSSNREGCYSAVSSYSDLFI